MTPQEAERIRQGQEARAAVMAKMADPEAPPLTEDDAKHMSGEEIGRAINARRFQGVGPDRRLTRR